MRITIRRAASALGLALAMTLPAALPATAAPMPAPATVHAPAQGSQAIPSLRNRYFGLCLDSDIFSQTNGGKIQLWTCNGSLQQKWAGTKSSGFGGSQLTNSLVNRYSERCLDADTTQGGVNGNKVQLWQCNGTTQQAWAYTLPRTLANAWASGKCLDADTHGGGNGGKVQLWQCNNTAQQTWDIVYS